MADYDPLGKVEPGAVQTELKRVIENSIERAEERLFNDFDSSAVRLGATGEDVVAALNEAHESDLAEKYENWLAEGDD